MNFQELNLIAPILKALQEEQYEAPSPIQEKAIPPALLGRDVLGCAQTGTGKTAAFAVPILQRLNAQPPVPKGQKRAIRSLILTPTRELAIQIGESLHAYGRYLPLRSEVIFGGVSQVPQVNSLNRGVDILVATPGRLNDLIQQGFIDLGAVQIFVLDEADRMLDMGFIHDVKRVITHLPRQKQTLFFSATMPPEITELVDSLLVDPFKVAVAPVSSTAEAIEQSVYFVDKGNKPKLLIELLKHAEIESALVFTRTKHGADRVARELVRAKIQAQAIHGNKSQTARQQALSSFKARQIRVLVATDIAARGIDIDELSHVINYDLPNVPETYVHRIGRTGRAGLDGTAISFCNIDEKPYLKDIEALIGKPVPVVEDHPYPMQVFTLTPPKQPTPRPQRAQQPQHREKQRSEGTQRQERPRQAEKANDAPKRQAQPKSAAKTKQRKVRKDAAARPAQAGRTESAEKPAQKQAAEPKRQAVKAPRTPKPEPAARRAQQEPAAVKTEPRAAREQSAAKPPEKREAAAKDAARRAPREQLERQPEQERRSAPAPEKKEDYLTSLGPRKKGEPPRPLLTREHTSKKPADQFLSDKPYFRKG
ncbi:DEAD/DEAH box helicase [Faecalispora sporosphaeroides]|jgi:ATP-dependent RNA helicase RhlE|uniref:ATP-dependent RNA helicase CshA n=1 Tax=Faecalispora sporosphaeroides TaxID=1549 RepID=A0A928KQW6_9FIRM|nr:DEAD/DEAH box helicase [Faecalispora sporosphaeroides]MBE6832263.1 DEAD/DEAH box helicase [Faecalispora sporosphaeroides]